MPVLLKKDVCLSQTHQYLLFLQVPLLFPGLLLTKALLAQSEMCSVVTDNTAAV